jgi:hypothetical protein
MKQYFHKQRKTFLAFFRINMSAVCEMSAGRGVLEDYHDYPDSIEGRPLHMSILTCKRCGKQFQI